MVYYIYIVPENNKECAMGKIQNNLLALWFALLFVAFIIWAAGIWVGEFQKKAVNNCSQTRAELGLCK
jgi:hypothetical protein